MTKSCDQQQVFLQRRCSYSPVLFPSSTAAWKTSSIVTEAAVKTTDQQPMEGAEQVWSSSESLILK